MIDFIVYPFCGGRNVKKVEKRCARRRNRIERLSPLHRRHRVSSRSVSGCAARSRRGY